MILFLNCIMTVLSRLLRTCKVYAGRRPADVDAPAIIFFPLILGELNCGIAGLMTFKRRQKTSPPDADIILAGLLKDLKKSNLKKLLAEKMPAEKYLRGVKVFQAMEKCIVELKKENVQEFFFFHHKRSAKLASTNANVKIFLQAEERILELNAGKFDSRDLETVNSRLIQLKDIQWILEKDILDNFDKILKLANSRKPANISAAAFRKYRKINLLLNALDRLEVRGRDSAGLQVSFVLENKKEKDLILLKLKQDNLLDEYSRRLQKADISNGSIAINSDCRVKGRQKTEITFTYKTFSIVGALGRNVYDLRRLMQKDKIFQHFSRLETICETAISHTRWASVGSITEENCHPVNNYKRSVGKETYPFYSADAATINVALNGDIDNHQALRAELDPKADLIAPEITTDTKIIPLQIEKYLKDGNNLSESFRLAANDFEGSHAIIMTCDLEPDKIFLAQRGSGQSLYVGIASDQYMVSSELYGLVEVTPDFIKVNGTNNGNGEDSSGGQVFILDQRSQGLLKGINAFSYDGMKMKLTSRDVRRAEITTRDIDRGGYPHFFLKEISESALSIKKTLRGKYRIFADGDTERKVTFNIGSDIVPAPVRENLTKGRIKKILIIGHGTAAVAGIAIADAFERYLKGTGIGVAAKVASELSGFFLRESLFDTLIIPVTQSGTTTDTNRAVDMARQRGAHIIAIVNRRQSDITGKSHGVFYTSDGRDIEMSVASTKAFYSQIVAGQIMALYFAHLMGTRNDDYIAGELKILESAPQLMARIFARKEQIAEAARKTYQKQFWAVVGSGPNKAAADEIRIKLSELCYKTISSDIVENKKHIDLSAEPLILVCAAGNPEVVSEDIAKDVAIFKAHKAAVVVFADEGDDRFDSIADEVIPLPAAAMPLPVIINTMAGHLWGYYAACFLDKEALLFREFRDRLNSAASAPEKLNFSFYERIADAGTRRMINEFYSSFSRMRNEGAFNQLSAKTITDLVLIMKYAAGKLPLKEFQSEFKGSGGLNSPLDVLDLTLGRAIDELSRPIDAIRHQAKTVTVGTSRKEKIPHGILFDLLAQMNYSVNDLSYKNILAVGRIQPALSGIRGYTVYEINNLDADGNPGAETTITVKQKGGIALKMTSRTQTASLLMGTKRTIVSTGRAYVGRGKSDGASIVILPLLGENNFVSNLILVHVEYNESLSIKNKREVLGYRYNDVRNLVNEYNVNWDDEYLEKIPLAELLSEPVEDLAERISNRARAGI